MKKFLIWLGCLIAFIVPVISVKADDVSYRIPSYKGHLSISDNSSATFTQEITYDFESDYHGQYVTLGSAKPVPDGFYISGNPTVTATVNGQTKPYVKVEASELSDGTKLKVYNQGHSGDKVVLKVTWQINRILNLYSDVAVLLRFKGRMKAIIFSLIIFLQRGNSNFMLIGL